MYAASSAVIHSSLISSINVRSPVPGKESTILLKSCRAGGSLREKSGLRSRNDRVGQTRRKGKAKRAGAVRVLSSTRAKASGRHL